ncbi:MAG: hypothetical protein ABIR39_19660 [Nocardioides sp.]|uniref:hypothetical protein n=1 Tax=Nocardioides sp. TaxID=35761 RepID=UPI003262E52D
MVLATALAICMLPPTSAQADDEDTTVTPGANTLDVGIVENNDGGNVGGNANDATAIGHTSEPQPTVVYVPICLHGDALENGSGFGCPTGEQLECGEGGVVFTIFVTQPGETTADSSDTCIEPGDPPPTPEATPPVDIPGEVLKAFEKVELPASTISIQPPGGQTLVNFKTILSTPGAKHQVTVHLDKVNIDVVLELTPSHFLWKHGDGTGQESTIAGAVWSEGANVDGEDFITHVYTKKLTAAQVSVDTTWSARFKGPKDTDWRPVDGTVTKVGEPVSLAVREATPQLVTAPN